MSKSEVKALMPLPLILEYGCGSDRWIKNTAPAIQDLEHTDCDGVPAESVIYCYTKGPVTSGFAIRNVVIKNSRVAEIQKIFDPD